MSKKKPEPTVEQIRFINTEHRRAVEAGQRQLEHAIACGTELQNVRDNTSHGDWTKWLAANCPEINERTDRLYRQLASKQAEIEKASDQNGNAVTELSIRAARKLIAKSRSKPANNNGKTQNGNAVTEMPKPTNGPIAVPAPTTQEQLKKLEADNLVKLIRDTFPIEYQQDLATKLVLALKAERDGGIPSFLQRQQQPVN